MNHWGYGSVKMLQLQPPAKQEVIRVSLPLIDPSKRQQEDIWVTPPLAIKRGTHTGAKRLVVSACPDFSSDNFMLCLFQIN